MIKAGQAFKKPQIILPKLLHLIAFEVREYLGYHFRVLDGDR